VPEPDIAPGTPVAAPDGEHSAAAAVPLRGPRWGMGEAVLGWLAAQLGAAIVLTFVLGISGDEPDDLSLGYLALAQTGLWAGFLGVPWLASRFKGNGLVADFGLRATRRDVLPDGLNGAFWGLFSQFVVIPLLYAPIFVLTSLDVDDLGETSRELTDRATDGFGVTMLVLIVGIGAPAFEELFWRGLALRAIERRFGTWPAVIGSGVLFGASHLNAPLHMPGLMVFGVVLGVLTVRSGRLWPAVAAHMAFNLATVVVLLN
jgi:hypothetical protein